MGIQGSGQRPIGSGDLDEVEREFSQWRDMYGAPSRIPEHLWSKAAVAAARYGVGCVAQRLRLNYTQLKRRAASPSLAAEATTFIELLGSPVSNVGECALEIECERGTWMRVVMKSVPSGWLAGVLREFAR